MEPHRWEIERKEELEEDGRKRKGKGRRRKEEKKTERNQPAPSGLQFAYKQNDTGLSSSFCPMAKTIAALFTSAYPVVCTAPGIS